MTNSCHQMEQLERIATKNRSHLVTSRSEFDRLESWYEKETLPQQLSRLVRGFGYDLKTLPSLLEILPGQLVRELKERIKEILSPEKPDFKKNGEVESPLQIVPVNGWAAFNSHMGHIRHPRMETNEHSLFDTMTITRRVKSDALSLANAIRKHPKKTVISALSRGGLVSLVAAAELDRSHEAEKINHMLLISPVTNGVPKYLHGLINTIGSPALTDLLPGSEAIQFWQRHLSAETRKRITIVIPAGTLGDGPTRARDAYIEGSTMILTPPYGHESAPLPGSPAYKITMEILELIANTEN